MEVPPPEMWMTVRQVAECLGVSRQSVESAIKRGKRSITGDNVSLMAWKVVGRGWVTTREELSRFHRRLNS